MSKIMHCKGCGAKLQTDDPKQIGYVKSIDNDFCQSCFRLKNYGESHDHFHPEDLPVLEKDALIVMVSSVLNLDMLFEYPVYRYQNEATFVYLINQIDLLPRQTNTDLLLENITKKAKHMNIPYLDIIMMSAKNLQDIKNLNDYLSTFKNHHIYLIGVQNSGKTTIFKALTHNRDALAFKKAGLTQEPLYHKLDHQVIWDMPGLFQKGYIHEFLPYETYKKMIPDREIKPRIYQLKKDQALMIEGLISITVPKALSVVLYLDDQLKIHKTNAMRVKDLLNEGDKHFDIYYETYEQKMLKIPEGKHQMTFADFGFLHVEGPVTVEIMLPKGLHLSLTEALFK
ncbi:MAG: 50S ribosome-binding GTPase [Acholeplasmataceae bacterium]|nr:50S ribosome-binding GTPase [Acholeplasmataceae bacterium]